MFILATACGQSESELQTAVAQTAVQLMTLEATLNTPTYTPVPSETPIPPTETPVPTPTEVKETSLDEEGDCEVVAGHLGDGGCQVDIFSFDVLPCPDNGMYEFGVEFFRVLDPITTDVCFMINSDGDPNTGFEDEGFLGIDWVYCWVPESAEVIMKKFNETENSLETFVASNPYRYVNADQDGIVNLDPFLMVFPLKELEDIVIADNAEVTAQGLYYDFDGNMVFDGTQPLSFPSCPVP
jgi:hypothetical protein